VACGDAPSAPRSAPADAPRRAASPGSVTLVTFTYNPAAALDQSLGAATRSMLARRRGVRPRPLLLRRRHVGTAPCTPLKAPIDFTVRTWTTRRAPHRSVQPRRALRAGHGRDAPAARQGRVDRERQRHPLVPDGRDDVRQRGGRDASLLTSRDPGDQFVFRRLKHFSGYTVVVDRSGDGSDSGF
jgi:hypothetical protein